MNTPTASLRNTIISETLQKVVNNYEDPVRREEGVNALTASMRNTFNEEIIDEVVVTTNIEKPVMGLEGVTTLTASLRNIIKDVPKDASEPNGWKDVKTGALEPAEDPRERVEGVTTPTASKRNTIPLAPLGVLAPRSVHARPFTQPPIDICLPNLLQVTPTAA